MKLAIGKADFARLLANVGKVVESRNTIPILSHARLVAADGVLRVTATDLDIVATDYCDADVAAPGQVCVDAKLLTGIISKSQGDIDLELDGNSLKIKSGRSRFTLSTLPAEDFPDFNEATYDAEFETDLAALFAPCVHCISTEATRYYLNGIFFNGSVAASTDGHRLVKHKVAGLPEFAGIIVPRKVVGLLPKGGCKVAVSDSKIRIEVGSLALVSKLIDGTFPDFERVIPRGNSIIFTVDRDDLARSTDRVASISSERGRGIRLALAPGGLTLSARSDVGDAADEIAAAFDGEPVDSGYNSGYLREMLGVLPDGPVKFAFEVGAPAVITSEKAPDLTCVLMPVRI
jgi:DNA polymerase-3 subunit beta